MMSKLDQEPKLSRMDRKKKETRKKIVNTTIRLIQDNGFEATTMEQIAKDTDIAKGTLYNYYSVKEAIISDYIKQTFDTKNSERLLNIEDLDGLKPRMLYIINNLMEGVKQHKEMFEKYLVYQMQQMVSFKEDKQEGSGISTPINNIIQLGQEEGEIRCDLPTNVLKEFFLFIFIEIVKQYYKGLERFDEDLMIEKNIELFMNGVKPMSKDRGGE